MWITSKRNDVHYRKGIPVSRDYDSLWLATRTHNLYLRYYLPSTYQSPFHFYNNVKNWTNNNIKNNFEKPHRILWPHEHIHEYWLVLWEFEVFGLQLNRHSYIKYSIFPININELRMKIRSIWSYIHMGNPMSIFYLYVWAGIHKTWKFEIFEYQN